MTIIKKKSYYLISKRERWGLTLPGLLFILLLGSLAFLLFFNSLFSILAPTERTEAYVLVLEGSVNDHVLNEALREYKKHNYKLLITTGTPVDYGSKLSVYKNTATIAGYSLLKLGFDSSKLVILGTDNIMHDRTFNSAVALKRWLRKSHPEIQEINLMSLGVHGGRSRLLFQAALGDSIRVGIISVPNLYYGSGNWWKSSKGFRETFNEAIGYFYTRYFFRPYENEIPEK